VAPLIFRIPVHPELRLAKLAAIEPAATRRRLDHTQDADTVAPWAWSKQTEKSFIIEPGKDLRVRRATLAIQK
jgi:hypothetical protein